MQRIAPDRKAILSWVVVLVVKRLKAGDHGIASDPNRKTNNPEKKQDPGGNTGPWRQRRCPGAREYRNQGDERRDDSHPRAREDQGREEHRRYENPKRQKREFRTGENLFQ